MKVHNRIDKYSLVTEVYGNYYEVQKQTTAIVRDFDNYSKTVSILEIGCGSGITTNMILNSRSDVYLTSIDNDIESINYLKRKFTQSQQKNIKFIQSDALNFIDNCEPESFDLVISGFTIHNFTAEYRNVLYKSIHRIMKKNSIFLNVDKYSPNDYETRVEALVYRIGRYINVFMKNSEFELLKEWVSHYIDDQTPEKVMIVDHSLKNMENCGFKEVSFLYQSDIEMLGVLQAKKF